MVLREQIVAPAAYDGIDSNVLDRIEIISGGDNGKRFGK